MLPGRAKSQLLGALAPPVPPTIHPFPPSLSLSLSLSLSHHTLSTGTFKSPILITEPDATHTNRSGIVLLRPGNVIHAVSSGFQVAHRSQQAATLFLLLGQQVMFRSQYMLLSTWALEAPYALPLLTSRVWKAGIFCPDTS